MLGKIAYVKKAAGFDRAASDPVRNFLTELTKLSITPTHPSFLDIERNYHRGPLFFLGTKYLHAGPWLAIRPKRRFTRESLPLFF